MKILFISYYLPPLLYPQSIQIGRFLQYLKNFNDFSITVITAKEDSRVDNNLYPKIFDGIKVHHIDNNFNVYINIIKNKFFKSIYKKPDTFLNWMNKTYGQIVSEYNPGDFDIILTFSQPFSTNILGKKLKQYFQCKWIAHNSDPWVDNPYNNYNSYLKRINSRLEDECFNYTDQLLFTSMETALLYKNKYKDFENKIDYINHSFDINLYSKKIKVNNNIKIIRYIGTFYGKRSAKPILDVLNSLDKSYQDKFILEFIGSGKKTKILVNQYGFKNVKVTNAVEYQKSLELMEEADLLLVIDAQSDQESVFFPSKLADYIGSGVEILGLSPIGTTKRIIEDMGYKCFNPDELSNIVKFIEDFIMRQNIVQSQKSEEYNIVHNIDKFIQILKK